MPICNIAHALSLRAQESPERSAIHFPVGMAGERVRYRSMSYAELDARSSAIAAGLTGYGIGRGVRTVLMVRPSPELYLLMFALCVEHVAEAVRTAAQEGGLRTPVVYVVTASDGARRVS